MNRRTLIVLMLLAFGGTVGASTLSAATSKGSQGLIAFSADVHGVSQVFTVRPDGTRMRQITHGPLTAAANGLSWSPDGRRLLFVVFEGGGGDHIFKSRADGSGETDISSPCTGTCLGDDNPTYSPDGKKIAFERAFGPIVNDNASLAAIFTMNADGSRLTQVSKPTQAEDHQPDWSPDGTKIAFYRFDYTRHEGAIEVMSADGRNLRRVTPFRIDATNPHWSPNGKELLFNTYANPVSNKDANLFTMHADGTHRVALTHYTGGTLQAFADGWSPDGTQVLFRRMAFSGTDTEVGGYFILNLRTKHVRRLTPVRIRYDAEAAWGK